LLLSRALRRLDANQTIGHEDSNSRCRSPAGWSSGACRRAFKCGPCRPMPSFSNSWWPRSAFHGGLARRSLPIKSPTGTPVQETGETSIASEGPQLRLTTGHLVFRFFGSVEWTTRLVTLAWRESSHLAESYAIVLQATGLSSHRVPALRGCRDCSGPHRFALAKNGPGSTRWKSKTAATLQLFYGALAPVFPEG